MLLLCDEYDCDDDDDDDYDDDADDGDDDGIKMTAANRWLMFAIVYGTGIYKIKLWHLMAAGLWWLWWRMMTTAVMITRRSI